MLLRHGNHRLGRIGRRRQRRRHVHHQDGVVGVVVEQLLERHRVPRRVRVAGNVDGIGARPDRRQRRIELFHRIGRNVGQFAGKVRQTIHRQHADAAAIGQYRQPLAGQCRQMAKRLGGGEQLVEIEHPQQPGAPEGRIIDRIRAGQRPGMGHCRLGALGVAPGFDDEHRLGAGSSARRRHEFARVLDRFDVEQNGPRFPIHGEIIEQVGKIDVDAVANGDDGGKSDAAHRGPFHQSGRNGAGLGDQRQVARPRHRGGKARIEFDARHQHAEAIGPDEAQSRGAGIFLAELGERTRAVTQARGKNDRGSGASAARGRDKGWNGRRRRRDHDQIGCARQLVVGFDGANALDGVVVRIDEADLAREAAAAQIPQHGPARRLVARAGPDHGDGSRRKQLVETISRHCPILSPTSASCRTITMAKKAWRPSAR